MRTVLGSAALAAGGFLLLCVLLTLAQWPGVSKWVSVTYGVLAVALAGAGLVLLGAGRAPRRCLIVVPALAAGFAALVFAVTSKNSAFGKYCGIEGSGNQTYRLTVRVFGKVLHEETAPAVTRVDGGSMVTAPSAELDTKMVWWELGLDAALVAAGALAGGLVGAAVRRLAVGSPST